jgi:ankyrin repeat protein
VLLVGLVAFSALLYLFIPGSNTGSVTQTNRPAAAGSPLPTPSPTPAENTNLPPAVTSTPVVGPDELAARERLALKNIPFNEAAFARAVDEGDTGSVDLFLAAGMSPDVRDGAGGTALIGAAARGRNDISRKLLRGGADVNARDADGSTALMQSAAGGHQETTEVLLAAGADLNLRDNKGQTALIRAAARGHADVVRKLIRSGARLDVRDRGGRDALAWAEENDRSDVIDLLKKARAGRP